MKAVALGTAIVLLLVNAALYPILWTAELEDSWEENGNGNGGDVIIPIDAITVTVPQVRAGDLLQYDYTFFGEMYWENRTSGNWSRITLMANGQLLEQVVGGGQQRDGYNQPHDTWQLHTEITLSVMIKVVSHSPGEDNEPLIIHGTIKGGRDRHATVRGDIPILNYAGGTLGIDEISGLDLPVTNFKFDVNNWAYPDPHIDPERSLEERIYGRGATLSEGLNGTYGETNEDWYNYTQWYNWSIDASERVNDYDCARLNISLDFFGFITLEKYLWLSSDVPRPVRIEYNSSTFFTSPTEKSHIILETTQTLLKNGYTRGSAEVPIRYDVDDTFIDRHPYGQYHEWEMLPSDGSIQGSSFDLGLEEAVSHAIANSADLREWMRTHPSPMINEAMYTSKEIDARTMEYTWNMSLSDEPGDWNYRDDWLYTNGYSVNVTKRVERRVIGGDLVETFIASEHGTYPQVLAVPESALSPELVTLASSESIWASVSRVATKAYANSIEREVDFTESRYFLEMGGVDPGGFGIDLLDTLTGITVPTSNLTWVLQVGNVWEGASTYMVALDAETGRMLFISDIDGPQSLQFIFGL